jgi:hypothetical protein
MLNSGLVSEPMFHPANDPVNHVSAAMAKFYACRVGQKPDISAFL